MGALMLKEMMFTVLARGGLLAALVSALKAPFMPPAFKFGDRVNHVPRGRMARTDGFVLAQDAWGVRVEWPRGGQASIPADELCQIG